MSSSVSVQGQELIEGRAFLDLCEAKWLVTLAEFDSAGTFELDGHGSSVHWLVERCGMGRSTAKEKLRLAHELRRRPVVGAAFVDGRITYSKARALTRLAGLNDERDERIVAEFAHETADMLERLVRYWNLRNGDDKEREPDPYDIPRIRFQPGFGGAMGRIIIDGTNEDLARIINVVDAYGSFLFFNADEPVDEASVKPPTLRADDTDEPAESTAEARGTTGYATTWDATATDKVPSEPPMSLAQRRYGWFVDLVEEIALVRDDQLDPNRATIAVTVPYESLVGPAKPIDLGFLDAQTILTGHALRRVACDAGISRMVVKGASEILDVGRTTRTWNRAQRRAIRARHGWRCAVQGCDRRVTEIHHLIFWDDNGTTCIENGVPLCSRHHHMVHDLGWTIAWDPTTGVTTFTGPQRQSLASEVDPFLVRPPAFAA